MEIVMATATETKTDHTIWLNSIIAEQAAIHQQAYGSATLVREAAEAEDFFTPDELEDVLTLCI